jgi:predicted nucleic acid-binding protein
VTGAIVCDASAVVAVLVDSGSAGRWAARHIAGGPLVAPHLLAFEVANVLRRHERADLISADQAAQAHIDLVDLPIELWPYTLLAQRAWQLRGNLTLYDAAYVALAEHAGATLVTLDDKLAGAPGIRCAVATPAGEYPGSR